MVKIICQKRCEHSRQQIWFNRNHGNCENYYVVSNTRGKLKMLMEGTIKTNNAHGT